MLQQRRPCTSGDGFLSFCIAVTRGEGPLSPMDRKKRKEVEVTVNQPIVVLEKKKKKVVTILGNLSLKMTRLVLSLICLAVKMCALLYKNQHEHLLPIAF